MPEYPSPGGEDELYGDAGGGAEATSQPEESTEESGETALIPKSLCPGMSPGDDLHLKIVRVHDDQYEVAYPGEDEKSEAPESKASMPMKDEMAGMME